MTHLRIEQNTITENVTFDVIHKLYETAKAIIDAEEANDVQESQVSLKGNLQVSKAYEDEVNWLEAKFPDLHINVTGGFYFKFEDPIAEQFWANTPVGDGAGVSFSEFEKLGAYSGKYSVGANINYFGRDNDRPVQYEVLQNVTSLIELKYTKITNFTPYYTPIGKWATNLKRIAFPATTVEINSNIFGDNNIVEYLDLSLCDNISSFRVQGSTKLQTVHVPPTIHSFYGNFIACTALQDVFAYGSADLTVTGTWGIEGGTPVFNLWVQDVYYNDWVTYLANTNKTNKVTLKRFSEYTGDDLIQKWIQPTS